MFMISFKLYSEDLLKPGEIDIVKWGDKLTKNGWEGKDGSYATTYVHPDKNFVIKVYSDPAYDEYINFLKEYQNHPNVVKVKKHIMTEGPSDDTKSVALEKLEPITSSNATNFTLSVVAVLTRVIVKIPTDILMRKDKEELRRLIVKHKDFVMNAIKDTKMGPNLFKSHKHILSIGNLYSTEDENAFINRVNDKAFRLATRILSHPIVNIAIDLELFIRKNLKKENLKRSESHRWDLHEGNFMIRPSTGELVLSDPIAPIL